MNKRKIVLLASALMMVAVLAVGGTLAYFTDTDTQTNTFTMGKVGLKLDETEVIPDENGIYQHPEETEEEEGRTEEDQTYLVFPGDTVLKDPTIWIDEDSQECWVAAKITVTGNLTKLLGNSIGNLDIHKDGLITGGVAGQTAGAYETWHDMYCFNNGEAYITQSKTAENTWVITIYFQDTYVANDNIVLFENVNVPAYWDNDEAALFNNAKIQIDAFAVQANNFTDAYEAMQGAVAQNNFEF